MRAQILQAYFGACLLIFGAYSGIFWHILAEVRVHVPRLVDRFFAVSGINAVGFLHVFLGLIVFSKVL